MPSAFAREEGPWKLVADMPARVGGRGSSPTPGVFGRAQTCRRRVRVIPRAMRERVAR